MRFARLQAACDALAEGARRERGAHRDERGGSGLATREFDRVSRASAAVHLKQRRPRLRERAAIDRDDHVAGAQSRPLGRTARLDVADEDAPERRGVAQREPEPHGRLEQAVVAREPRSSLSRDVACEVLWTNQRPV